jgi:hypothetical protein
MLWYAGMDDVKTAFRITRLQLEAGWRVGTGLAVNSSLPLTSWGLLFGGCLGALESSFLMMLSCSYVCDSYQQQQKGKHRSTLPFLLPRRVFLCSLICKLEGRNNTQSNVGLLVLDLDLEA